jgi:glucose-6-phosphate isomerase
MGQFRTTPISRASLAVEDLLVDYSKNRITTETMPRLFDLARQARVLEWRDRMMTGEKINRTEDRAVLHVALRNRSNRPIRVDGKDVMPEVNAVLAKMRLHAIRADGRVEGYTGKPITDVVNIGIGGSDLGPAMASLALKPYWQPGLRAHFVSNVDGTHLGRDAGRSTAETDPLHHREQDVHDAGDADERAERARVAHLEKLGTRTRPSPSTSSRCPRRPRRSRSSESIRTTCSPSGTGSEAATRSGAPSALPIALVVGMDHFEGAARGRPRHGRALPVDAELEKNVPVVMALLGVWYMNFFGAATHAILPYDQSMSRFAAYFQQGDMESNGKRVDRDGRFIDDYTTGPIVWGEPGTNGQHAFYQLLHQGTRLVPCDFLAPIETHHPLGHHHEVLLANFLRADRSADAGKTADEVRAELEAQKLPPSAHCRARAAQDVPGQPADDVDPVHEARRREPSERSSRSTSTRSSRRASSGTSSASTSGASSSASSSRRRSSRSSRAKGSSRARLVDQRPHQPLQV